ncbi:MAG TPA: MmgE/PrpD family protein [Burkholderiales bacterium]|nr:MmgE/PrpD family protein [Burkholderiales bacterium]
MALTQDLAAFVARVGKEGVPPEARAVATTGFIDCIGTMIAGSREPITATLLSALAPLPAGNVRLWFGETKTSASEAALIMGVAAHALDYDDVALRGHPSAALVPAILAAGQELGATGAQMLDAYVAGYEVWANLVDRETDVHHMKGWHPTGIFGAIGAAAACAALRKLDAKQASCAIGLGASQSAGLMANFGSMAKPFHAGRAAQAGVMAARLAAGGFTSQPDVLEHPQGFLAAVSPKGNVDRERGVGDLGKTWSIVTERLNVKKYPTCYYTHRSLDAMLDLLQQRPLEAGHVKRVDVTISRENATVLRNHRPATALDAKFSIEFAMAGALVARKVGLTELDDDFVRREPVQSLYERVHVTPSDDYDPDSPGSALVDQVAVTMDDGSRHESAAVRYARGHAQLPLADGELRAKFIDCLRYGRYEGDSAAFFDKIAALDQRATL